MYQAHYLTDAGIKQYKRQILGFKNPTKIKKENEVVIAKKISRIVYLYLEIPFEGLKEKNRKEEVILAKHFSIFYMRKLFPTLAYETIANIFGFKTHVAARHAFMKISNFILTDTEHRNTKEYLDPKIKELLK